MKYKKSFFVALVMAICILIGTIPISAISPYGFITLTFTSEDDVDLSNIMVYVYEAIPAEQTDGYVLYNETLSFSVESNKQGKITFEKPSQYCSVSIDLSTLPSGTGTVQQTKFFLPNKYDESFEIALIDTVEVLQRDFAVCPTFYSYDGQQLIADYKILMADSNYGNMTWQDVNNLHDFAVEGIIVSGSKEFPFYIPIDVSEKNILSKYEMLNIYGMISDKEKIMGQCNALLDPVNETLFTFETVRMIENYKKILATQTNNDILHSHNIEIYQQDTILEKNSEFEMVEDVLDLAYGIMTVADISTSPVYEESVGVIIYSSDASMQSLADNIAAELQDIYTYFVTSAGFRSANYGGRAVYVEITPLTNHATGLTYVPADDDNKTIICINPYYLDFQIDNRWKTVLAHEYCHAIQFAYGYTQYDDSWLLDSMANFASAMYAYNVLNEYSLRYSDEYSTSVNAYMSNPHLSLHDAPDARPYSLLFPAYLYMKTNGWATIQKIYETAETRRLTQVANIFSEINDALKGIDNSYSLQSVFENFCRDNLFPNSHYGVIGTVNLGRPSYSSFDIENCDPYSQTIEHLGAAYHQLENFSDDSGTILTFDMTSGNYTDLTLWGAIHNANGLLMHTGLQNPEKITPSSMRFSIEYYHGSSQYPYYSIIAVNKSTTVDLSYNLTIS